MKKNILALVILLITNILCVAQTIGEWTTHTPGMKVTSVDIMHNKVFAATPYDIFYYNTDDNSVNHLSKVNGLSDIGINIIKYDSSSDLLFVGYTDTNIDLIDNHDNVTNIPDIYNKYILGNKTINNAFFHNDLIYVCCGFGIVVIDIKRNEVKDTYIIGNNGSYLGVNDLTICDNVFYAATENGIYYASADNQFLADYSQWKRFINMPHQTDNFSNVETFDGYVVANYSDNEHDNNVLFAINDTTSWSYFLNDEFDLIKDLRVCEDLLIVTENTQKITVFDTNKNIVFSKNNITAQSTVFDPKRNCYWCGTITSSLAKLYPDGTNEYIWFNGPFSDMVFSITAAGKDLWMASGGYTSTWAPTWKNNGISHYNGDSWSYLNSWNVPALDTIFDITYVKADPLNNSIVYAGSYSKGLVQFENKHVKNVFNPSNSTLGMHLLIKYTYITGFDFDSNNNLWIANSGADKMLSVYKTNGTWQAFNIGSGDIGRLMVDKNDIKWVFKRGGELIVFDGNTTKTVNKNASLGSLPGDANCFVTDNKGTVWIGTTDGVALFYDSKKIFKNSSYACSRILIPRNDGSGQADYLLSGQSVLAIAVDGANNMWFGTNNGVIHTSNDGQTTLHHFTMENSPLFSNTVKDIAIDDDGNVFFATDKGIISYKGTASKGYETNTNVIVYPNPVRPEHQGIVGIKGLVTDALIKITTTSGAFVTHLKAEGGQATWDCTDINGRNVEPGIYLIFVSDETGNETYATKVLIMK